MESPALAAEAEAQAACKRNDYAAATNIVFAAYGNEIYTFVLSQFRGQQSAADEVFSTFSENFWRALPAFQWRCSVRAWCYKLARSASSRYRRSPHNRRGHQIPLDEFDLDLLVARTRTRTQAHLRTDVKDKVRELREALTRDEQDLLVLRVDRALSWRDAVHAMMDEDVPPDEADCHKMEAALRQRFSETKKRLRVLAEAAGLI